MDPLIGKTIDSYKILEVIGRGGMGVVYKARDTALDKLVALKMMDPRLAEDASFLKRFRSEARALAKLEHPNIVNVYALRETEYGIFIVMEYVDGITLSEMLSQSGSFHWRKALPIFHQLLAGLGHAHQAGVLHRDIKPRNILITHENHVKIMDFGLAKILQASDVTVTHTRAGTLFYMAPEQVRGLSKVDQRSDLYSMGMTFYELLTGTVPFSKDDSELRILEIIVKQKLPPPNQFQQDLPKDLSSIIMKALEKDPEKRYQSAEKMTEALSYFESNQKMVGEVSGADDRTVLSEPPVSFRSGRGIKKYRIIGAVSVFVVLLIILMAIPSWRQTIFRIFSPKSDGTVEENSPGTSKFSSGHSENRESLMAYGSLIVNSDPSGATVFLNGEEKGKTPFKEQKIPPDDYTIRLDKKDYKSWQKDGIQVEEGREQTINAVLKPVQLTGLKVRVIPEGSIFVDGKQIATDISDSKKLELAAGTYQIEFRHPRFGRRTLPVKLNAGDGKQLTCYFESYVNIQSLDDSNQPFWGTIVIDGQEIGRDTPISEYPLPVGRHEITVRRAGYRAVEGVITIDVKSSFQKNVIPLVFHLRPL